MGRPIPREIPSQSWLSSLVTTSFLGGVLPFGAVFTELFFMMTSLWQNQFYYLFGILPLVLVILAVTCAEISITLTYFRLAAEDYNWWWPSFLASGASSLYLFLYACVYFYHWMRIKNIVSASLYFGY